MPEQVNEDDLAAVVVEVPGEGSRLLMCLLVTYHDAGADGLTIVAMADNMQTLADRVREEGLMVRRQPVEWNQLYPWQQSFGSDDLGTGESLLVLDLPPAGVRGLNLQSLNELHESIERLRVRQEQGAKPPMP